MRRSYDTGPIGSLTQSIQRWDPRKSPENATICYIDISSVNRHTKRIEEPIQVASHEAPSRARQIVSNGDVLVSTVRPNLNAVACVDDLYTGATASTGFTVLRPKPNLLDNRYLYYWARSPTFVEKMMQLASGASYPAISDSIVKTSLIPLPPLSEQHRIAAILDKADAIRRKRQEALALTDEFLRSAFVEMFGDPVTNPKGWEVAGLADLVGGPVRNGLSPSNRGSYPGQVLTLSAITKGIFQAKKHKEALFDTELPKDKRVDSRDFLICRGNGNIDLVGTGVFPTKSLPDVLFPDTMIGFRINLDNVTRSYLEILWKSRLIRRQIEKGARTTNGTYKINQNILNSISFPLPPIKIQQQFDNIAIHVVRVAKNMSDEIDTILFDSLTQRAFRGEL